MPRRGIPRRGRVPHRGPDDAQPLRGPDGAPPRVRRRLQGGRATAERWIQSPGQPEAPTPHPAAAPDEERHQTARRRRRIRSPGQPEAPTPHPAAAPDEERHQTARRWIQSPGQPEAPTPEQDPVAAVLLFYERQQLWRRDDDHLETLRDVAATEEHILQANNSFARLSLTARTEPLLLCAFCSSLGPDVLPLRLADISAENVWCSAEEEEEFRSSPFRHVFARVQTPQGLMRADPRGVAGDQFFACPSCHASAQKLRFPGSVPSLPCGWHFGCGGLPRLSVLEETLVARLVVYGCLLKLVSPFGPGDAASVALRGHLIAMPHAGGASLAARLPRRDVPAHLQIVFLGTTQGWVAAKTRIAGSTLCSDYFAVSRDRVFAWIRFLRAHNPMYSDLADDAIDWDAPLGDVRDDVLNGAHVTTTRAAYEVERRTFSDVARVRPQDDEGRPHDDDGRSFVAMSDVLLTDPPERALPAAAALLARRLPGGPREAEGDESASRVTARVTENPVCEFTMNNRLLAGSFPQLFPFGGAFLSPGPVSLSVRRYLLSFGDGRFQKNSRFIFMVANQMQRHAASRASIKVRGGVAAERFRGIVSNPDFPDQLRRIQDETAAGHLSAESLALQTSIEAALRVVSEQIPHSAGEREGCLALLSSLVQLQGLPSFFVTVAPSDLDDLTLLRWAAAYDNPAAPPLEIRVPTTAAARSVIASGNPGKVAQLFQTLVERVCEVLLGLPCSQTRKKSTPVSGASGVFGRPRSYFGVVDTQARGAMHVHMLFWGGVAPELLDLVLEDRELRAEALRRIDLVVTTDIERLPELDPRQLQAASARQRMLPPVVATSLDDIAPRVQDVARDVQVHHHSATCQKGSRGKYECRLAYPQEIWSGPTEFGEILNDGATLRTVPLTHVTRRITDPFLQEIEEIVYLHQHRSAEAGYNVPFSPAVANCLACNQSINTLGDAASARSALFYMVKYITKTVARPESSMSVMFDALEHAARYRAELADGDRSRYILVRMANRGTGMHELPAPVAAHLMWGFPAHFCSDDFCYYPGWAYFSEASGGRDVQDVNDREFQLHSGAEGVFMTRTIDSYLQRHDALMFMTPYEFHGVSYDLAADVVTAGGSRGRRPNATFEPRGSLLGERVQRLRSRLAVPVNRGHAPPAHPGPRPETERALRRWQDRADRWARFVVAVFLPWRSDGAPFLPFGSGTYAALCAWAAQLRGLRGPQPIPTRLQLHRLQTICNAAAMSRLDEEHKKITMFWRHRLADAWAQSLGGGEPQGRSGAPETEDERRAVRFIEQMHCLQALSLETPGFAHGERSIEVLRAASVAGEARDVPARAGGAPPPVAISAASLAGWIAETTAASAPPLLPHIAPPHIAHGPPRGLPDVPSPEALAPPGMQFDASQTEVLREILNEIRKRVSGSPEQTGFTILGGPGAGKSFVASACERAMLSTRWPTVKCLAPTGIASTLLPGGRTYHSEFTRGRTSGRHVPIGDLERKLREYATVQLVIVDELSMLTCEDIAFFDTRLRALKRSDLPFGGILVLLFGDFMQLPPIGGPPLYSGAARTPEGIRGQQLFAEFRVRFLSGQNRARGDLVQQRVISQLRRLDLQFPVDAELIRSSYQVLRLEDLPGRTLVVAGNDQRLALNRFCLREFCRRERVHFLRWVVDVADLRGMNEDVMMAHPQLTFECALGAPGFLTENVSVARGLANGTAVRVARLAYTSPDALEAYEQALSSAAGSDAGEPVMVPPPAALIVVTEDGTEVPLRPSRAEVRLARRTLSVTRPPFDLGFACTFHKVQGRTIDSLAIDLNATAGRAARLSLRGLYVALTRVRRAEDVRLFPMHFGGDLSHLGRLSSDAAYGEWVRRVVAGEPMFRQ